MLQFNLGLILTRDWEIDNVVVSPNLGGSWKGRVFPGHQEGIIQR